MSFEVEKRKHIRKKKFKKKEYNLAVISLNAMKMARELYLTEYISYHYIIKNPRLYRKKGSYISR